MINELSLKAVCAASFGSHFLRPLYETYCFSKIPGTIKTLLGVPSPTLPQDCFRSQSYDSVVLFLIDAFGWKYFQTYGERYPFLKRFIENGIASKITSQFPSTTAAHITCLNLDLEVGQHGIYEWFYYEPALDRIIAPLLFSFAGDKKHGTIAKTGIRMEDLLPYPTVYEFLAERDIFSMSLQPATIAHSPYSKCLLRGSESHSYTHFAAGIQVLLKKMEQRKGYYYVYFGEIDAEAHRHGWMSKEAEAAIDRCFRTLEEYFWQAVQKMEQKIAVILTADHGMIDINPDATVYLNEEIPSFHDYIQRNRAGDLLVPAGSSRDFFLHLKPDNLSEGIEVLRSHFKDRAAILQTDELMDQQFFGSQPLSEAFIKRVGNVVILPYNNHSIWWHEKYRFEQHFHAMHGGLSPGEMETAFLFKDNLS